MDTTAFLSQFMDSKISSLMLAADQKAQRERRYVPNSTRMAFDGQMASDSRMLMQSSQNMKDAMGMVQTAQTGVTGIKAQLAEIYKLATDLANNDDMSEVDFTEFSRIMEDRANEAIRLAEGASFNGFNLHDGSAGMNGDGVIVLSAGGEPMDQVLHNLLNGDLAPGEVVSADGSMNLNGLINDGKLQITSQAEAEALMEELGGYIDKLTAMEGFYSNDFKSLENLSIMFEERSNIFTNTIQYKEKPENEDQVNTASYLEQLMQAGGNGSVFSGMG